jgi:hypothetical protein
VEGNADGEKFLEEKDSSLVDVGVEEFLEENGDKNRIAIAKWRLPHRQTSNLNPHHKLPAQVLHDILGVIQQLDGCLSIFSQFYRNAS